MSKNGRILVTGARGFMGHHLVKRFRREWNWVRGVDLEAPECEAPDANEFEVLDLRHFDRALLAVRGGIDQVYDLAGIGFITAKHTEIARNGILIDTKLNHSALCRSL